MELASRYVLVGLIWLIAAMIEGFWMGLTGAMQYLTLHVGMVLSGGVLGMMFGTMLRVWPNGLIRTVARLKPRTVQVPAGLPAKDPEGNLFSLYQSDESAPPPG